MNFVILVSEHVDLMHSEDIQLIGTFKDKYLQIKSRWKVMTIILYFGLFSVLKF
jgi:hypothetical protein